MKKVTFKKLEVRDQGNFHISNFRKNRIFYIFILKNRIKKLQNDRKSESDTV